MISSSNAVARYALLVSLTAPHTLLGKPALEPCRLKDVQHEAQCGSVARALNPAAPEDARVDVHFAVIPALARNKLDDPVFFFAGGPGQSAIDLAGQIERLLTRLSNRRDIVLIDQRGTGKSAPLECEDDDSALRPLAEIADADRGIAELRACREELMRLPHGDLRFYTTTIAMADADAVREALGYPRINAIGGSYGTRAVLEYMRQFPDRVRRAVIDGVAPPDMVLPASFSPDVERAFNALLDFCEKDPECAERHPHLRARWHALLAAPAREVTAMHPYLGREEPLVVDREAILQLVRGPLYSPALASALPHAVEQAAAGRFTPLLGLAFALLRPELRIAVGMQFSVICAEDMPRLDAGADTPGEDFGQVFEDVFRRGCEDWPRGAVPAEFYQVPKAPAPTLVLSGGIDPVTPPRHGERVAKLLGERAVHVIAPNAGHGVMSIGCMPDVLFRFINEPDDDALKVDAECVTKIPRPPAYVPLNPLATAGADTDTASGVGP